MRKALSIFLAIILIIGSFPAISMADNGNDEKASLPIPTSDTDITVADIKVKDKDSIRAGETFELELELKNNSSHDARNVMVGIEKSPGFEIQGSGSKKLAGNDGKIDKGTSAKVEFSLKYNGNEDTQLPIKLYYKLKSTDNESDSATINDYIDISQAKPEEEKEEIDGSDEKPNLTVTSSKTHLGESGDTITIPVEITNNSRDSAYNISTSLNLDGSSPLYIDGPSSSTTRSLRPGQSTNIDFKVKIDKNAEAKNYPIHITSKFYNRGNIPQDSLEETIYVRITDNKSAAQVVVNKVDIKPDMDIEPGGNVTVGFEIENKGDSPARDVKVSLKGLSNQAFSLASGLNSQSIPMLERGKARYIFFQLKSSRGMASGNHDLEMNLSYKDMKGQEFTEENKFFIPVKSNRNQSSNLIIENLKYPTGTIGINQDVDLSFSIRNQGQTEAQNIVIKAESGDQSGLVPKTVSTTKVNSLKPGDKRELSFKFLTTQDAETKNHPINITVEYEDDLQSSDEKSSLNQFVGVFVLAPDDPEDPIKSTPRLIIDKYDFEPQLVKAGDNFEMNLSFFNTNSSKTVKNIKIYLTAEENIGNGDNPGSGSSVFTPVDSSNTFYIDSIPPKGRVEKAITMFTIPDAVAKTHMITANFEYEDGEGEEYTATELIGVPVVQQSRLETGELSYSPESFVGDYSPISLEFYNTGKVTLYNMMVRLEGDFQTENGSYYIGNFENGSSDYFEGTVIPSEPGELEGAVVFSYEDSTGEEQEIRKEFTLNVMDAPPMDEFPDDMPPMDDGSGGITGFLKSKLLWTFIVLLAAGFGGFKFYKKKKADNEEEEFSLNE